MQSLGARGALLKHRYQISGSPSKRLEPCCWVSRASRQISQRRKRANMKFEEAANELKPRCPEESTFALHSNSRVRSATSVAQKKLQGAKQNTAEGSHNGPGGCGKRWAL